MMAAIEAFHFERPLWLLLLLPAILLWWAERRVADPAGPWRRVIDAELLKHLLVGGGPERRVTPAGLILAAWCLATVAVAGPAWKREPSPFADAKPPVMVVLAVTPSMMTPDLAPTRLDRARQKLADLLRAREGAATGLVAYSGSAHLVLPPTPDGGVVLDLAKALSPQIMPREGDDLPSALALAERALSGQERGGSILVMADTAPESGLAGTPPSHPRTILGLVAPDGDDAALAAAARSLDADLVRTTVDGSDVETLADRLDRAAPSADVAGEGTRWVEAGYWLTPVLALIVLLWFRRGWVLE
jgi:Ca-activated chloride channel family protein